MVNTRVLELIKGVNMLHRYYLFSVKERRKEQMKHKKGMKYVFLTRKDKTQLLSIKQSVTGVSRSIKKGDIVTQHLKIQGCIIYCVQYTDRQYL